ncbi:MAG: oxaloacetate decarboxylase [Hyphomicrobiaceae bacterium]|nr:oxaloacetate decarboxylase [Hyphomicrobiaceae bacterium]
MKLRSMIDGGELVVAPGCFDGLSARLVERAGFGAAYASGGAIARSRAIPDMGLVSLTEVTSRISEIVDAVSIPVIADMDTGFGNALNARHAVQAFERAGVAAFHIEDQIFPKKCGHYENKGLVSELEFVQKIRAVKDALQDSSTLVIARTDAIAVEGFSAAIDRASAYAEAGADVLFVEAPTSMEQIEEIAAVLPGPKLMNMFHGGKTPLVSASILKELGYQIVIVPSDLQRAAIHAMNVVLDAIKHDGDSGSMIDQMASFKDREEIVGTAEYMEQESRYGA